MSAIAGAICFGSSRTASDMVGRVIGPLEPFGRDGSDIWNGGRVALARLLTRFLPEDDHDRQPLHCDDQQLNAVFIGRIDNRHDVETSLGISAQDRRELSDGALAFEAWRRWGQDALDRLYGAFTLVVWDEQMRRLVCARSPTGAPPLYWHSGEGFFVFASTPTALHAVPEVPRRVDERRLARFLVHRPDPSEPRIAGSFFEGIERLAPGHLIRVDGEGRVEPARYWSLANRPDVRLGSDDDYAEALREHLDRAVSACLRSNHPIGSQLSGGRDSSAVTASAAALLAARGQRLAAFTAVPREGYETSPFFQAGGDEGPLARLTAERYSNIDHVLIRNRPERMLDVMGRGHRLYNRPMGAGYGMVWTASIRDAARERGIQVLLTGGYGNLGLSEEGFGRLGELAASGAWFELLREHRLLRRSEGLSWRNLIKASLPQHWVEPLRLLTGRDAAVTRSWSPGGAALVARAPRTMWTRGVRNSRAAMADFFLSVDNGEWRNGAVAGWAIDERDPTASRALLEFCNGIPSEQFLRDGKTRAIYRRAFGDRLPAEVLNSHIKGRQSADWHEGLTALREEIPLRLESLRESPLACRVLDVPRLERLVEEWKTEADLTARKPEYFHALTTGLMVGDFIRWAEGRNR
jgi:asparagine synthase (glutamine-hydrolysing)